MFSQKTQVNIRTVAAQTKELAKAKQSHAYRAPELHDVGKAIQLVQGGGGSYADNNRARQY